MKLLCYITENEKLFKLNSKYKYTYDKVSRGLTIEDNKDFINGFYSNDSSALDIQLIVGKNGAGKTYLLNQIFQNKGILVAEKDEKICITGKNINIRKNGNIVSPDNIGELKDYGILLFSNSLEASNSFSGKEYRENIINLTTISKLHHVNNYDKVVSDDVLSQINFINCLNQDQRKILNDLMDVPKAIQICLDDQIEERFLKHMLINFLNDIDTINEFFSYKRSNSNLNQVKKMLTFHVKRNFVLDFLEETNYKILINTLNDIINDSHLKNSLLYDMNNEGKIKKDEDEEEKAKKLKILKYYESIEIIETLLLEVEVKNDAVANLSIERNNQFFNRIYQESSHYIELKNPVWEKISSGQYYFLNLFGRLNSVKETVHSKTLLIMIDEVDLGLHPDWQRRWVKYVPTIISNIFINTEIQLLLTTHSPIILSDLLKDDVSLIGDGASNYNFRTFANNIHELMAEQFFLQEGVVGAFAKSKIDYIITDLQENDVKDDDILKKYEIIQKEIGESMISNKVKYLLSDARAKATEVSDGGLGEYIEEFNKFKEFLARLKDSKYQD